MAGNIKQRFGSIQTLAVTGLQSLASDAYWQSGQITMTDLPFDLHLFLGLQTNTSAGSAVGYARVWLATSNDGTTWTGDATGTEGTYAPTTPNAQEQSKNLIPLGIVSMKADETTARFYERLLSVLAAWKGAMPIYAALVIQNKTGQAFNATGNVVTALPVYSQYT